MADGVNVYSGQPGNWSLVAQIPLAFGVGYGATITVDGVESELVALNFPVVTPAEQAAAPAVPAAVAAVVPGPETEPEEPVEDSD